MVASNRTFRFSPAARSSFAPANWVMERVHHYFARHPEVSREDFLLDAVGREIDFLERPDAASGPWQPGAEGQRIKLSPASRQPLTGEDIRLHVWLNERLAILHQQRNGIWVKLRRFLFSPLA